MRPCRRILDVLSKRTWPVIAATMAVLLLFANQAQAAEGAGGSASPIYYFYWALAFGGSVTALVFAWRFFKTVMAADEGNDEMKEIAGHVRDGADTYIWQQYKVVAIFFVVIVILLAVMAFGLGRSKQVGAFRLPHRRVLFRFGRLVRHEDGHLRQ